jgi:hypothetical protein
VLSTHARDGYLLWNRKGAMVHHDHDWSYLVQQGQTKKKATTTPTTPAQKISKTSNPFFRNPEGPGSKGSQGQGPRLVFWHGAKHDQIRPGPGHVANGDSIARFLIRENVDPIFPFFLLFFFRGPLVVIGIASFFVS